MGWLETLFGKSPPGEGGEGDPEYSAALRRAEQALNGLPERDARFLACVAILLARVAYADLEISPAEKEKILEILKSQINLPPSRAAAVCSVAIESTLTLSTDLHIVLRRLNETASREQKHSIIRALFHAAAVDDISEAEDREIGQIAAGLILPRSDFIAIRSEFREHVALLKGLPKT